MESLQALIHLFLSHVCNLTDKGKILLRRQEVDKETFVDIGTCGGFPLLALCWVDAIEGYFSLIGFQQVEQHAEEGGLSCAIVTYQTQDIPVVDSQLGNIAGYCISKCLF